MVALSLIAAVACTSGDKNPQDSAEPVDSPASIDTSDPGDPDDTERSDRDGDGTPDEEDCEPDDPAIHPGAEETWYDGVDRDCAGDDDFDADGDGHRSESHKSEDGLGDDCDDANPAVHPDADDAMCDGVDADCAGDDDYDTDGDGALDPACGGDDCDEDNPWTHPGAEEWCDEVDHDCNGETLDDGVCAKAQEMLGVASLTALLTTDYSSGFVARFVGDLDADGTEEVASVCLWCSRPDGSWGYSYYVLSSSLGATGWDVPVEDLRSHTFLDQGWEEAVGTRIGDFDGDGFGDWALLSPGGEDDKGETKYQGVGYLLSGPSSEWSEYAELTDVADRIWNHWGEWGIADYGPGDLNGDGYDDYVIATYLNDSPHLSIIFGEPGPETQVETWDEAEVATRIYGQDFQYGGHWMGDDLAFGDFDGDGMADLLVNDRTAYGTTQDYVYVLSGPDLDGQDGARVDDLALQVWEDRATCLASLGDWNGDGYDDWAAGNQGDSDYEEEGGALYFVAGDARGANGATWTDDSAGIRYGSEDGYKTHYSQQLGSTCWTGAVDGGDALDLYAVGYSDTYWSYFLMRADALPEGVAPYEADMELMRTTYDVITPYNPMSGDWDGDGDDDLLLDQYMASAADGPGGFALIPGWDIPWEEEQWW